MGALCAAWPWRLVMKLDMFRVLTIGVIATSLLVTTACEEKKADKPKETTAATTAPAETTKPAETTAPAETTKPADANAAGGSTEPAEGGGLWVKSDTYKVKFRIPDDWNVNIEKDGISATDSDETTTVVLVGSESHGMVQAAVQDVQKKVKIEDAKIESTKQVVINGFAGQNVRGTAVLKASEEDGIDQEIQFVAYNLRVNKDTVVTMMIFSEAEMYEAKKEIIEGLAQTLTKG